jgi:mono/diheme cytochrome c family protein
LYEEKCDFVVGVPVDKRLEGASPRMALTRPYLTTGFAVVVGPNVQAGSLADLKGKRIGVEMHTAADFRLFERGYDRDLYENQAQLFKALVDGKIAAGVMWAPVAGWLTQQQPSAKLRILAEAQQELTFPLAIAVRKEDSDLLKALDQAADSLIRSGKRDEIVSRYGFPKVFAGASNSSLKSLLSFSPPTRKSFLVAVGGKRATVVDAPEVPEELIHQGNVLYHRVCGKCHGRNGISGGISPDLRRFQGSDQDFITTAQTGRPGTMMPSWKDVLSEDELVQIRAYVKSLGAIE